MHQYNTILTEWIDTNSQKTRPFLPDLSYSLYQNFAFDDLALGEKLSHEELKEIYEKKGYPKDWIDKRLRGIAIRQNLTDEWKERGITKEKDFAILTAEISKATFGLTPSEYKNVKGLTKKNQNLRDHMTDLELIFTMLGERVTTEISQQEKPEDFEGNKDVARRGGNVAGVARKETEKELGHSVISSENFLNLDEKSNGTLPENNLPE